MHFNISFYFFIVLARPSKSSEFERSYDAAQAREERKRSKEGALKKAERTVKEEAVNALAEKLQSGSSPTSPSSKVGSPKIIKQPQSSKR